MEEISEFEKMTSGGLYHAMVPELISRRARAKLLSREYNTTIGYDIDMNKRQRHLEEIFGKVGSNCTIEPPLRVDYGKNISIGENVYFNFDVVILDCAPVTIGDNLFVAPGVHIYTAKHPLDVETRCRKALELASPVHIGNDVWIGGKAIILPGVTIGDGCVIGAGSVVTKDVPPHTLVVGNPARVLRKLV